MSNVLKVSDSTELAEVLPTTIHRLANEDGLSAGLNANLGSAFQDRAKALIREIRLSPTRKAALEAYDQLVSSYQANYPKRPSA
jgi:hypothetical protein